MQGLLISSDVEVCAYDRMIRLREGINVPNIVPPAQIIFNGTSYLRNLNDDPYKPVFIDDEDIVWFGDGALLEVAFKPASNPKDLFDEVSTSVAVLKNWLKPLNLELGFTPVGMFDLPRYIELPEIYQACISGCNADKNALINEYESTTVDISDWDKRGMGGHIHMSIPVDRWGNYLHKFERTLLRLLAITANMVSVLLTPYPEMELRRKERFGHSGSYRTPIYPGGVYGFEYRAPSSSWLLSQESVSTMFNVVDKTLDILTEDLTEAGKITATFLEDAVVASDKVDKTMAELILSNLDMI